MTEVPLPPSLTSSNPSTVERVLATDPASPARSQSFSGTESKPGIAEKKRKKFQKRSTLSLDQPASLRRGSKESLEKVPSSAPSLRQTMGTSIVVQRSKTFSKFVSASNLPEKTPPYLSDSARNGLVPADNEFLMEFRAKPDPKSQIEEGNMFPVKAKLTHLLKTSHAEQSNKLHHKHQQECDLIEDIRNFSKQRSQIEKDYGQALQKLVAQYQRKDLTNNAQENGDGNISILGVWRMMLDATTRAAQGRISGSESFKNHINEATKKCRVQKEDRLKKSQELLSAVQCELAETVKELSRAKKKFQESQQAAMLAREKYEEADERLRKNQTSIFKSKSGLEKAFLKLQQKRDEDEASYVVAKNEYLLHLAAANAHQKRYYEVDLPQTIKLMDGEIFNELRDCLASISRYELKATEGTTNIFNGLLNSSAKICRDHESRCFMKNNPIFEWAPMYEFEPGHDGEEGKLEEESQGEDNFLNREARRWTFRVERDTQQLVESRRQLEDFRTMLRNYQQIGAEMTSQDLEAKIEKCRNDIRKLETNCLLGGARLALLRLADVDVDSWAESAKTQVAKNGPLLTPGSYLFRKEHKIGEEPEESGKKADDVYIQIGEELFDDEFDENFIALTQDRTPANNRLSYHSPHRSYPLECSVCYPYEATRVDELTIAVGDELEVIGEGDLEEWVKARDRSGKVGFVPENYLRFSTAPPKASNSRFLSGSPTHSSSGSRNDEEVQALIEHCNVTEHFGVCFAKALYSYIACTDDELSFPAGAVINVLSKDDNGVDDGWWKGELNGKTGVFPELVVEEIGGKDPILNPSTNKTSPNSVVQPQQNLSGDRSSSVTSPRNTNLILPTQKFKKSHPKPLAPIPPSPHPSCSMEQHPAPVVPF